MRSGDEACGVVWGAPQLEQLEELNGELREERQDLRNELGASVATAHMQDDRLHRVHAELQARAPSL